MSEKAGESAHVFAFRGILTIEFFLLDYTTVIVHVVSVFVVILTVNIIDAATVPYRDSRRDQNADCENHYEEHYENLYHVNRSAKMIMTIEISYFLSRTSYLEC